jgi:excinuclease UvrABC ATPase subunit
LQQCTQLSGLVDSSGTVLELLGLAEDLAAEIARTRKAKELGLIEKELELPHSKFHCLECSGVGRTCDGELCNACQGGLYDWRVGSIEVLGRNVQELLRTPVKQLTELLWTQSATDAVIQLVATYGGDLVSLSTPVKDLNPATRRFLKLLGGLGRFGGEFALGSDRRSLSKELLLIDGPYGMPDEHQLAIRSLVMALQQRGATVLYASMPESLEVIAQSVLRFRIGSCDPERRNKEQFLDTRYAQISTQVFS